MNRARRFAAATLAALVVPACAAADSPTALAQRMQKAVAAKDVDAFAAEFDQLGALDGHGAVRRPVPGPRVPGDDRARSRRAR